MRATRVLLALGLALGATAWAGPAEAAVTFAPVGSVGFDVSYPQCGTTLPAGGAFATVGVNDGKSFTANPCLAGEYAWATSLQFPAMVYLNTGNPGTASASPAHWPGAGPDAESGVSCANPQSNADNGCAYIYGRHAAASALSTATSAGVTRNTTWWLDVETANTWAGTAAANAAALQGMLDFLRASGVASVGLYSTTYQWGRITGGYSTANADTYRASWSTSFTPAIPLESGPNWVAGVDAPQAAQNCGQSFTGGPTMLAQYIASIVADDFDHDLVCGAVRPAPANAKACLPGAGVPLGYRPVWGTRGNDHLTGTSANEIFYAGPGSDVVKAGGGDDILCGGTGPDILKGQNGNDVIVGDNGNDRLYGGRGQDTLYGKKGDDLLDGGPNRDRCSGGGGRNTSASCP